jgi:hypothetical protein
VHKGFGVDPEDHLWWAAKGFLELNAALSACAEGTIAGLWTL